jgi:hypothetical protein
MRRGALIVGEGGRSLLDDLCRMPRIVFDFVTALPRAIWRIGGSAKGGRRAAQK